MNEKDDPGAANPRDNASLVHPGFSSIVGMEEEKQRLRTICRRGHVSHAYLFSSHPGNAALPLAVAFMLYKSCEHPTAEDSCGSCATCLKTARNTHPDVHFFCPMPSSGASEKREKHRADCLSLWRRFMQVHPYGTYATWCTWVASELKTRASTAQREPIIGREQVGHLLAASVLKPYLAREKYMFLWLPEKMNTPALNALLKTLEDPPPRTYFIFVSHAIHEIFRTLRSRMHTLPLRHFSQGEVVTHLRAQGVEPERAVTLSALSGGVMHVALQEASRAAPLVRFDLFYKWWRVCWTGKYGEIIAMLDHFYSLEKIRRVAWLHYALRIIHLCIGCHSATGLQLAMPGEEEQFVRGFSKTVPIGHMERLYSWFNRAVSQLERNSEPRLLFLQLSMAMCALFSSIRAVKR